MPFVLWSESELDKKTRKFEEAIKKNETVDINPSDMYKDLKDTLKIFETIVTKEINQKGIFENKDVAKTFLQFIMQPFHVEKERVVKNEMGNEYNDNTFAQTNLSLFYLWLANGQYNGITTMIEKMRGVGTSLDENYVVEALFRQGYLNPGKDQIAVPNAFQLLTRTEESLALLNGFICETSNIFVKGSPINVEEVLLAKIENRFNPSDYETGLSNLIMTDGGVKVLATFQERLKLFLEHPEDLAKALMRKIKGSNNKETSLLDRLTSRKNGNKLILSWLTGIDKLLWHLTKIDLAELIQVLFKIQSSDMNTYHEAFTIRLVSNEQEVLNRWVTDHKDSFEAKKFLEVMFRESVIKVSNENALLVLKTLYPDNYLEDKNQLSQIMSKDGGMEFCIKILEAGFENKDGVYESVEQFLSDLLEIQTESGLPLLYDLATNSSNGKPVFELLLKYKDTISNNMEGFVTALLAKSSDNSSTIQALLTGDGSSLALFVEAMPEIVIEILERDSKNIEYFCSEEGVDSWIAYTKHAKSESFETDANTILSALESEAFHLLAASQKGEEAFLKLIERSPIESQGDNRSGLFVTEEYMKRWIALFSSTASNDLIGLTGMACLSMFDDGACAIRLLLSKVPEMLNTYTDEMFKSLTEVATNNTNYSGHNAIIGLNATNQGIAALCHIMVSFPGGSIVGDYAEWFIGALTSVVCLQKGSATAFGYMFTSEGRIAFQTLYTHQYNLYVTYKDKLFSAIRSTQEGVAGIVDNMFGPISDNKPSESIVSTFLAKSDLSFLEMVIGALEELSQQLPVANFHHFWDFLLIRNEQTNRANLDIFVRNESYCNLLWRYIYLGTPPDNEEKKKKLLSVLDEKSSLGDKIRAGFLEHESGKKIVEYIDRECSGFLGKVVNNVRSLSFKVNRREKGKNFKENRKKSSLSVSDLSNSSLGSVQPFEIEDAGMKEVGFSSDLTELLSPKELMESIEKEINDDSKSDEYLDVEDANGVNCIILENQDNNVFTSTV